MGTFNTELLFFFTFYGKQFAGFNPELSRGFCCNSCLTVMNKTCRCSFS